jgi:hypothetical protein
VGAAERVQCRADWDLVTDDEHALVRALEQAAIGGRVAQGGPVEALAAGEAVAAGALTLPGAVLLERPALERADIDVVEEWLFNER